VGGVVATLPPLEVGSLERNADRAAGALVCLVSPALEIGRASASTMPCSRTAVVITAKSAGRKVFGLATAGVRLA